MANVFAILTAIVLAAAAFIASKNKAKYEAEIEARKTEESRLGKSTARLAQLEKDFDQTSAERKSTEEATVALRETETAQKKTNSGLEEEISTKQAQADSNAKKIADVEDALKEVGNIEELVEKMKTTSEELAQLESDISSTEARLGDLTAEKARTEGVIANFRTKDDNYTKKRSSFTSTRIGSIFPSYGFVTLPIGNTGGVISGSTLNVVRDGEVVGKLRVSSVEASRAAAEIIPDSLAADTSLMVGDSVVPAAAEGEAPKSSN